MSLLVFVSGCGYTFTGGSTKLPTGVQKIGVELVKNNTTDAGVENVFTNDLISQCTRNNFYASIDSGEADAVLRCTIKKFISVPIAHRPDSTSFERRVTAVIDVILSDTKGNVIKHFDNMNESEEYLADVNDKISTDENRYQAIYKISKDFAEKVIERMSEDF